MFNITFKFKLNTNCYTIKVTNSEESRALPIGFFGHHFDNIQFKGWQDCLLSQSYCGGISLIFI